MRWENKEMIVKKNIFEVLIKIRKRRKEANHGRWVVESGGEKESRAGRKRAEQGERSERGESRAGRESQAGRESRARRFVNRELLFFFSYCFFIFIFILFMTNYI